MGHVYVDLTLRGQKEEVILKDVLIDTGATYTILPEGILNNAGAIKLAYKSRLELGDGRHVEADFYTSIIKIDDREAPVAIATFEDAKPLIGVLTLESLGLKVDPTTGKLEPTRPKGIAYLY